MLKTLVFGLLFVLIAVPASAKTKEEKRIEEATDLDRFLRHAIQSFGWKCGKIYDSEYGGLDTINHPGRTHYYETWKIVCEKNLTYFIREKGKASERTIIFCHRGVCKNF